MQNLAIIQLTIKCHFLRCYNILPIQSIAVLYRTKTEHPVPKTGNFLPSIVNRKCIYVPIE